MHQLHGASCVQQDPYCCVMERRGYSLHASVRARNMCYLAACSMLLHDVAGLHCTRNYCIGIDRPTA
jgi:hypothetical protein